MRSIVHAVYGEPAEVLGLAESPLPEPGPGQARVRMQLSPIHNHDLWTVRGQYGYKPTLPAIAGSEAFGIVDTVGEGVDGLAIGQRVTTAGARGAWAEYFVVPAASLVPVPDAIDDASAAQLVAMPLSALMLLEMLDVATGDWIVQNAANGAVGKAMCSNATSSILAGLPGLDGLTRTFSPKRLSKEFGRLPGVTTRVITDDDDDNNHGVLLVQHDGTPLE